MKGVQAAGMMWIAAAVPAAADGVLRRIVHRAWDALKHLWVILHEAVGGFLRNDDLRQASSLAYYTALALIPAMLLLTMALGFSIGSSAKAMQRTGEILGDVLPEFGQVILREVGTLSRHKKMASLVNVALLFWSLTPLVGTLRAVLNATFKVRPQRSIWVTKGLDLLAVATFLLGASGLAFLGVALRFLKKFSPSFVPSAWLGLLLPFLLTVLLLVGVYWAFSPRLKFRHLLTGALTTAVLWFLLKPAFTLFLTHNPGYGLTFGSFKSVFIIIIWLYYSQAVLLFGAEVMAALHREETVLIKRLMEGRKGLPMLGRNRFVMRLEPGTVLFSEAQPGGEMYHLLSGRVSIRKGSVELAVLGPGKFLGEMSFLLDQPRSATAVALDRCECIVIHQQNFDALIREYPDLIRDMLTEMAGRLQRTSQQAR